MNRFPKIIFFATLFLLLFGSFSQSTTIAQVPETAEGLTSPPAAGDANLPPGESQADAQIQTEEENNQEIQAPDDTGAWIGSSFTYQGQLKNNNSVVNGYCDFIWDVFAGPIGGVSLATDSDSNFMVTNGLFTAIIDLPITVFDGNQLYLEIQVRCPAGAGTYTLLSPRLEIRAAPYALGLRLPFAHTVAVTSVPVFSVINSAAATNSPSIFGSSAGGDGVRGVSTGAASADNGVYGETNSTDSAEAGVKGVSTGSAAGGYFSSASGTALFANGDARQTLAGDGFVKAGVYVDCKDTGSSILRFFNNVNAATITVIDGTGLGRCTVDFGFDVSNRYVTAMSLDSGARIVTFSAGLTISQLNLFRYNLSGLGVDGAIMILIY